MQNNNRSCWIIVHEPVDRWRALQSAWSTFDAVYLYNTRLVSRFLFSLDKTRSSAHVQFSQLKVKCTRSWLALYGKLTT